MRAAEQISGLKLAKMTRTQLVEELIRCDFRRPPTWSSSFGNPALLNPRRDADITGPATASSPAASSNQSDFRKTAAVMKLVVNGFAGAGTIELGGYDYHDSTRATGERKDFIAGQAMGAVLEYAARRGRAG